MVLNVQSCKKDLYYQIKNSFSQKPKLNVYNEWYKRVNSTNHANTFVHIGQGYI